MATRFQFHRLVLDANEQGTNARDDVLPVPTLDERVSLYLRAVHGNREFTEEERSNARNLLLNSMAGEIAAQVIPTEQSLRGELAGRAVSNITYEYKGFKVIYGNSQSGRIARIYQDGQLRSWASDLEAAVQWIDESTHGADGGSSLVSRPEKSAQTQESAIEAEVTEERPLHPYEAPTQYRQSARRKETIRAVPIARRPSTLALTATLGLVLIVTGGTLGYRWTHPDMADEVTAPAQQAGVPPPTTSPRSLSTVPASGEAAPARQASVPPPTSSPRSPEPSPDKAAPGQHVLQIVSRRGDAHMLNVFLRLKQEQPALFAQAALKPTAQPSSTALSYAAQQARGERPYGAGPFTGQLGPFASEEDAAAACRVLEAADIQCVGRPEGK